jgi:hypothetical protein
MKSVTISEVVRAHNRSRLLFPIQSWRQLASLATTLALGLPAIMLMFHLIDPATPLACIVIPVLAGGLLPVFAALPGRFEMTTRFDARYLVPRLDDTLKALGYAQAGQQRGAVRYRARNAGWFHCQEKEISVRLSEHALEIVGPIVTLRALQRHIAC